jgi:hypothetical protein
MPPATKSLFVPPMVPPAEDTAGAPWFVPIATTSAADGVEYGTRGVVPSGETSDGLPCKKARKT